MKSDKKEKDIEVKLVVLEVIKKASEPILYRLDCLLKDHYSGLIKQSDLDLMALLEFRASTQILNVLLEEYLDMKTGKEEEEVTMPLEHFTLIATTSKTVEAAYRSLVGTIPLWTH